MMFLCTFASLAIIPFVTAQSSDPGLEIKAIQAHFSGSGITPSLLPAFNPSALLSVTFGAAAITPGQALTQEQVAPTPSLSVTPANSTVSFSGTYTIAMVDAGPVGTDITPGVTRHWLVNGVQITDNKVGADGTAITQYAGPAPPAGSGPHRYVILLFSQPSTFTAPAEFSQPNIGVSVFDFGNYIQSSGLGPIVAGNYITVEVGTATASISATSAVVTSTLAPASSTNQPAANPSTSSGSGTGTGTGRPSATPTGGTVKISTNGAAVPLLLVLAGFLITLT